MPTKVFLGPNHNFWCEKCNIPIFELNVCPLCNSKLKRLQITPPYETKPAFDKDLKLIREVIDLQYGAGVGEQLIPSKKIVLLNKAPYYDRMDEIIIDGFVIGNIRFNPLKLGWEFLPKIEGARRLVKLTSRKWIQVDDGAIAHIMKGANVLAPGVIDYDKTFDKQDYLIVITSEKQAIATGPAQFAAQDLKEIQRGMVVKTKDHDRPTEPHIKPDGQDWDLVLKANRKILEKREEIAKNFIIQIKKRYSNLPLAVSFSGGKDSLCLLLLVLEAIGPIDVFFIDTGIEFQETVEYTRELIKQLNLEHKFTYKKARESFWDNLEKFGPPAKDYRWCCKVIKLATVTEVLNNKYSGKKVVTFIGSRQYESVSRYQDRKIWTNLFLPQQIGVSPIHNWPSLLVWLFLLFKKIKINPLYFEGYKRIGCIYCPATRLSELELLRNLHPELYEKWMAFLRRWAKRFNLSNKWADYGFWRWRKFKQKGQINLSEELKIPREKIIWQKDQEIKFHLAEGVNPCQDGSFSIDGRIEGYLEPRLTLNHLSMLGAVKYSKNLGIISLRAKDFTLNLFSDGTITLRGAKKSLLENKTIVIKLIKRANNCIGCGICIPTCPEDALQLKENRIWVNNKICQLCYACFEVCPILKYGN
ncbi:MAG: phosphoadenosine phosphosulfate reductase domain-containing protein [Candidatus Helarchaeota archaeon]